MYLKNLVVTDNGIEKRIVWSKSRGQWASVCSAHRSTDIPKEEQGTFQVAESGDILVTSHKDSIGNPSISMAHLVRVDDNQVLVTKPLDPDESLGNIIQAMTHQIMGWLNSLHSVGDSYLPAGFGWDGRFTLYDQTKRDKIRTLLYGCRDEVLVSRLVDAGQISTRTNVPLEWEDAIILPHTKPCELEFETGDQTRMVFCIQWLPNNKTSVFCTQDKEKQRMLFGVKDDAIKVMIGSLNQGQDPEKVLASWRLYVR